MEERSWIYRYWYAMQTRSGEFVGEYNLDDTHVSDTQLTPKQAWEEGRSLLSWLHGYTRIVRVEETETIVRRIAKPA